MIIEGLNMYLYNKKDLNMLRGDFIFVLNKI